MAEIKSTLDLIMEKTSHLRLNDDEKKEGRQNKIRNSVTGLVQKYCNNAIHVKQFKKELARLETGNTAAVKQLLVNEIVDRMTFNDQDDPLLRLLSEFFEAAAVEKRYREHRDRILAAAERKAGERKQQLADRYGISGFSVKPNLTADGPWTEKLQEMIRAGKQTLCQEKSRLKDRLSL